MANNRMFVRCRVCGEIIMIGKCYGGSYYTPDKNLNEALDKFFEEHAYCSKEINEKFITEPNFVEKEDVCMENGFEIAYETWNENIMKNKEDKIIDIMAEEILKLDKMRASDKPRIWETEEGVKEFFRKKVEE